MITKNLSKKKNDLKFIDFFEFNLSKVGLYDRENAKTLIKIASDNAGIHSARISTPYTTYCSRLKAFRPKQLYEELYVKKNLIKLRCMRTTLHIVPIEMAYIFHMATKKMRMQRVLTEIKKNNISMDIIEQIERYLLNVLELPVQTKDLEKVICNFLNNLNKKQASIIIKYLWEKGILCYVNRSLNWECEDRCYAVTKKFYGIDLNIGTEEEAKRKLFQLYVKCFGPISLKDAVWWSGLSQNDFEKAVKFDDTILEIIIEGIKCYMYKEDFDSFQKFTTPKTDILFLLAYEDSSLKAYYETRHRYFPQEEQNRIFNTIGEVMPCIVYNGKIVGKWYWDKIHKCVTVEMFYEDDKLLALLKEECYALEMQLSGKIQYTLF